jgi:hypothetical protein
MLAALKDLADQFLGRGRAAITVPVMDGALKPNRALDQAQVVAELPGLNDLALAGEHLWACAGSVLYLLADDRLVEQARFDAPISALAGHPDGRLALALGGAEIRVQRRSDGAWVVLYQLSQVAGEPLVSVNALAFDETGQLLFSQGSRIHGPEQWAHDLMSLGQSGGVGRWNMRTGQAEWLAQGRSHAFGVLSLEGSVLFSESWQHKVQASLPVGGVRPVTDELAGYPSRMAPASGGGFWLSCFVCRSQLVEFVLRERAYRQRMMAEIDPRHWIAPSLSSGHSFLEPLQGASVKQMGVLKPWAPPRSYGLVLRVASDGRVLSSLHSQVDGRHHGVTAVMERGGSLYVASQGSGRLLRLDLNAMGAQA